MKHKKANKIKDKDIILNCCFTCKEGYNSLSNLQRHFNTDKHNINLNKEVI